MNRFLLFCLGVFVTSLGNMFIIIYLNLLTMGYSFLDYVNFISRRFECYFTLIGIALIIISLKGKKIYERILRHCTKL